MPISSISQGIPALHSVGQPVNTDSQKTNSFDTGDSAVKNSNDLTPREEQQVQKMKARDREVRAHEQAHKAAAGGLARGGATFEYQTGPDGKQYAVSGEVKIDTSPVLGNPEATARKARQIQQAATAPAEPSAQDMQVAAQAFAMEQQANTEKREEKAEEDDGNKQGILKAGKNNTEAVHKNHSHDVDSLSKEDKVACAICGGSHSGETHTEANIVRLDKVFEIAQVASGRASVFSLFV